MGLPRAVRAHAANDLVEAELHYKRAIDQNVTAPHLFQNYGSLLAATGKFDLASTVYKKGLALYPDNQHIIRNFANLLRSKSPSKSISLYFRFLRIITADKSKYSEALYQQVVCDICDILISQDLHVWACEVLRHGIFTTGLTPGFLKNVLLLSERLSSSSIAPFNFLVSDDLFAQLMHENCDSLQIITLHFGLAFHRYTLGDYSSAIKSYQLGIDIFCSSVSEYTDDQLTKAHKLFNANSWNFSCLKLNLADFCGWALFDYGLLASAPGKQCWQRALTKPFTDQEIPIWRGESLIGKHLLVLEEQAVGDVMMFLTRIPDLLSIAGKISIFLSKRLVPIYRRTFAELIEQGLICICTKQDIIDEILVAASVDYQSPSGSVIQYLYSTFSEISKSTLKLYPNIKLSKKLRDAYLNKASSSSAKKIVVGVSWRGGGSPNRQKEKSFDVEAFGSIMLSNSNIKYVSLQYGDSSAQCESWFKRGIDIVYDKSINPLRDMDSWLAQVESCDAVLSVANTTIHGAGGLNKPTLCMLSKFCDWRWFYDDRIQRSYWYPSVGIAKQKSDGDWSEAISQALRWLESGCFYPDGPQWL